MIKSACFKAPALSIVSSPSGNAVSILGAAFGRLQDSFTFADPAGRIQQINQPAERICHLIRTSDNAREMD